MRFNAKAHEVCMKAKKHNSESRQIAQFHEEALRLAGVMSENQRRFLRVGIDRGKELEPAGLIAGRQS
jgi:hypothetical protein